MARIAGGSMLSLQAFLLQEHGDRAWERALARLSPEEAEPFRGILLPVNWYPVHGFVRVLTAASEIWPSADYFERYGIHAAEYEIGRFQRMVLRFTSPLFLLERAGRLWRRFHDTGEWQVEGADNRLEGTLRNFAVVDTAYCRVLTAWIKRACEMTGVHGSIAHTHCRARGADACVFSGRWSHS